MEQSSDYGRPTSCRRDPKRRQVTLEQRQNAIECDGQLVVMGSPKFHPLLVLVFLGVSCPLCEKICSPIFMWDTVYIDIEFSSFTFSGTFSWSESVSLWSWYNHPKEDCRFMANASNVYCLLSGTCTPPSTSRPHSLSRSSVTSPAYRWSVDERIQKNNCSV